MPQSYARTFQGLPLCTNEADRRALPLGQRLRCPEHLEDVCRTEIFTGPKRISHGVTGRAFLFKASDFDEAARGTLQEQALRPTVWGFSERAPSPGRSSVNVASCLGACGRWEGSAAGLPLAATLNRTGDQEAEARLDIFASGRKQLAGSSPCNHLRGGQLCEKDAGTSEPGGARQRALSPRQEEDKTFGLSRRRSLSPPTSLLWGGAPTTDAASARSPSPGRKRVPTNNLRDSSCIAVGGAEGHRVAADGIQAHEARPSWAAPAGRMIKWGKLEADVAPKVKARREAPRQMPKWQPLLATSVKQER